MNLATILDLSASCLGLFSALFFCVGVLHLKPERADEIATKMWGKGFAISEEMLSQKSDFIVGAFLLLLSFMVQFVVKAFPDLFSRSVAQDQLNGVAISVAGAIAITFVARILNLHLGKVFLRQVQERTKGKL